MCPNSAAVLQTVQTLFKTAPFWEQFDLDLPQNKQNAKAK